MCDAADEAALDRLLAAIAACRVCRDMPTGSPLPHEPRPVVRVDRRARLLIASQAPGLRVHRSGLPFDDASGNRLRTWLAVSRDEFYDTSRISFAPMGFCFPGYDAKGGDLPPRTECAPRWRRRLLANLPAVEVILLVGAYAQTWHLGSARLGLAERIRKHALPVLQAAETGADGRTGPLLVPLPHPSWRNTGWLKRNPWFEAEILPPLRRFVRTLIG